MVPSDDLILEYLAEFGAALSKTSIELNSELEGEAVSYSSLDNRLPILVRYELVEKVGDKKTHYRITDKGRAYLLGDLDAEDLERSPD